MKRRALLATLGSLGTAGLAGCTALGGSAPSGDTVTPAPVPPTPTGTPTDAPAATPTPEVPRCSETAAGYRDAPFPVRNLPTPSDRFDSFGCPAFEWADEAVCAHRADLSETPVALVGDDRAFLRPTVGDTVTFTLANRAEEPVTLRPGVWAVLVPGDPWRSLVVGEPGCRRAVPEGEGAHWWEIGIEREERSDALDVTAGRADLDEGRYLFAVRASRADGATLALATPFDVVRADGVEGDEPATPDDPAGNYTVYG